MIFILSISAIVAVLAIFVVLLHFSLDKKIVYKNLNRKHVVVTGGSSGIGKAVAIEAVKLGAHVTIIGRDVKKLSSVVNEIEEHLTYKDQQVQYASLDVTSDYNIIEKCFSDLENKIGSIFMLINCAGMCICGKFEDMAVEEIKQMIDLNYFGTAYPTKYVLPKMKEKNEGIIVFVSTEAALLGKFSN